MWSPKQPPEQLMEALESLSARIPETNNSQNTAVSTQRHVVKTEHIRIYSFKALSSSQLTVLSTLDVHIKVEVLHTD